MGKNSGDSTLLLLNDVKGKIGRRGLGEWLENRAFAQIAALLLSWSLKVFFLSRPPSRQNYSSGMTGGHHAKPGDNRKAILKLKNGSCPLNTLNNAPLENEFRQLRRAPKRGPKRNSHFSSMA
jgi:hypothetical protein